MSSIQFGQMFQSLLQSHTPKVPQNVPLTFMGNQNTHTLNSNSSEVQFGDNKKSCNHSTSSHDDAWDK